MHTELKYIIQDPGVVSSKECSTTTKTDSCVDKILSTPILSSSSYRKSSPLHLVQEKISEILSTSTPVSGILSPVTCSMIEILTTSNLYFFKFPRPITIISPIPTDLRLVSCIPYTIMSPCVQPRIGFEWQFNAHNILVGTKFIYGPHFLPRIEHLKYTMKIYYNDKNLSPTVDVMKITCGTHVTQSFKLKCTEKVLVTKQNNENRINLYYPKYNLNPINAANISQKYQLSTNDQTTMTDF